MTQTAAEILRDYQIDGVPASGASKPSKKQLRLLLQSFETLLATGQVSLIYANQVLLNADLAHGAGTAALVYNDATPANNGVYAKSGASGSGAWSRVLDIPDPIITLTVTGGTANAITASAPVSPLSPGNHLYILVPTANNLAGGVTVNVNAGAISGALKDAFGNNPAAGWLVNGSPVLLAWTVDHFQAFNFNNLDASGIQSAVAASATAAAASATAAASSASALANQVHQYDTLALFQAATVPGGVNIVRTLGRGSVGIGGASWIRLGGAPGTARSWHTQSGDGAWWIMQVGWFLSPVMFGTTAVNTAIQDALDYLNTFGLTGGRVTCEPNLTYTGTVAPVVWNGLTLDGNGSKLQSTVSGSGYGLRVGDNAEFRNGWAHSIDGGISGSSAIYGAGISLGETYGAGGTVGSPSYFGSRTRPRLRNVKASTTRNGGQAVQAFGDCDFDIDGLEVPDSTVMGGAFSADWGAIGDTTVAAGSGGGGAYVSDLERLTKWRTAFDAGTVYTTHPRGNIRRVRVGKLTYTSVQNGVIRLSACRDTNVVDVSVAETAGPVINCVGGDFGAEFALAADKFKIYRNIRFRNIRGDKCDNWGAFIDTYGDNLANAIGAGYSARTAARAFGDIVVDGLNIGGTFTAVTDGVRIQYAQGVKILNATIAGFANGIGFEDQAEDCVVRGCDIFANVGNGISVKAVSTILHVDIDGNDIAGNGTGGTNTAGVRVSGGWAIKIRNNVFGGSTETSQVNAVKIDTSVVARGVTIADNKIRNVKTGGTVFVNGAGGSDVLWLMARNEYGGGEIYCSGQAVIPIERTPRIAGATGSSAFHTRYICAAASMTAGITPPSGPTYVQGDLCEVPDAASAACAIARRGASTWASLVNAP
jgi:hypothetical protein